MRASRQAIRGRFGRGAIFASVLIIFFSANQGDGPLARAAARFLRARPGYAWSFPRDHGPHAAYKIEWWYYTGHLRARDGRRFAYQFTIFKVETAPRAPEESFPPVLYIAHTALADESAGRLRYHETFQRVFPGMAGARTRGNLVELFVENNRARIEEGRHRIAFGMKAARLKLDLRTDLAPVMHGQNGFSAKGPEPENASLYYSVTGLAGDAELELDGQSIPIASATGWMDHEFSSNFLGESQRGWDWFWFALDDGTRVMIFRVRSASGASNDFYAGTLIAPNGSARPLAPGSLKVITEKTWKSPDTGAAYPVRMRFEIGADRLSATAWLETAELRTRVAGVTYWEGPVDLSGVMGGRAVRGLGFAEMTGYAQSVRDL